MTRLMTYDADEVFRVKVTRTYSTGTEYTSIFGPYQSKNTAKGVATSKVRYAGKANGMVVTAVVETLSGKWEADK